MGRPRSPGNRDLPPNLYRKVAKGRTYYAWRDPRTGRVHSFGSNKKTAILDASGLNSAVADQIRQTRMQACHREHIAPPTEGLSLGTVLDRLALRWQKQVEADDMKASTQKRYTQHATQIRAVFGAHRPIAEITVRDISTFINDLDDAGKAGAATNLRSMLINTWKFALSLGEVEMNVPAATLSPKSRVKRQRLEIDEFMRVCDFAPNDVARRAFRLALMIGHRVGVIPQLRFADIVDDYLLVVPNKRGRPVRIPLSLRLDALGVTLGELVSECRSSGIVSRHLIHHVKGGGGVRRGDAVTASSLSHWFATAYRAANIKVADGKTPASFHELRSLCKRLYMQQGNVDTKVLLSHRSDATAETYADPRGGYQTLEF